MRKYENVDIVAALGAIVELNTNLQSKQPSIKEKIATGKQEIAAKKPAPAKAAAHKKNSTLGD
jgi:hypothetical protein